MLKRILPYLLIFLLTACISGKNNQSNKLNVVATTSLIRELVSEIGGNAIEVRGLMGAGVDPHLYKASEGDVNLLFNADIVFYSGLHLEGKMQDIFEKMDRQGIRIVAISDTIPRDSLISSANFASSYDPHIWFDISNWKLAAFYVAHFLSRIDTVNSIQYMENMHKYVYRLDSTEKIIVNKINELQQDKRILITAHDAFNYFGRAYGFEVLGLQGISTATEAGVQDVQKLADLITSRKVKAIFVETSVPLRNIEALREAVKSKGFNVKIGGSLFSDALGNTGTPEGTYTGMFMHNVNTIVNALK
ncbi:MAG TPA: zinc ABC transporter substrate-binding protein [Bacteroidales bacterium]|nr:zinc ABC transporter substrate-binding protein [Bacteroidales bacterium]